MTPLSLAAPWLQALGWTLLHSLWQLSLLAALAATALAFMTRRTAQARYLVACAFLSTMFLTTLATNIYFLSIMPAPIAPHDISMHTPPPNTPSTAGPFQPSFFFVTTMTRPLTLTDRLLQITTPFLTPAALAYLLITALLSLRLLLGYRALRRLQTTALPAPSAHLALLTELKSRLHLHRPIRLLTSAAVDVPTVFFALRPLILLPATALTGLSQDHLRYLLLHELAHIRRHDYLANLAQSLIDTLLFYHPAAHWLSGIIRQEREHCCDDLTLQTLDNRTTYAHALALMESLRTPLPPALGARSGSLVHRIHRILEIPMPKSIRHRLVTSTSAVTTAAAVAVIVYLIGCTTSPTASSHAALSTTSKPEPLLSRADSDITANASSEELPSFKTTIVAQAATLDAILQRLALENHLNLAVNWEALKDAGIAKTTAISATLHDVPFDKALRTLLLSAGAKEPLDAIMDQNVLTISTEDQLEKLQGLVTRSYDVRDLLIRPTSQALPAADSATQEAHPPADPSPSFDLTPDQARDDNVRQITAAIESTIAPDTWRNNGGSIGRITEFHGQLLIVQTAKNQVAITHLLATLRQAQGLQVAVEMRMFFVDDATYAYLAPTNELNKKDATSFLPDAELKKVLEKITRHSNSVSIASPRITLFNGQSGFVEIMRQQGFVADCTAITNDKGKVVPDYAVQTLKSGIAVGVSATVSADRRFIVMDLKPVFRHLVRIDKFPAPHLPAGPDFFIEKPVIEQADMTTRVAIPNRSTLMLAGLSSDPELLNSKGDAAPAGDEHQKAMHVVMLVRPVIVEDFGRQSVLFDSAEPLPNDSRQLGR